MIRNLGPHFCTSGILQGTMNSATESRSWSRASQRLQNPTRVIGIIAPVSCDAHEQGFHMMQQSLHCQSAAMRLSLPGQTADGAAHVRARARR